MTKKISVFLYVFVLMMVMANTVGANELSWFDAKKYIQGQPLAQIEQNTLKVRQIEQNKNKQEIQRANLSNNEKEMAPIASGADIIQNKEEN